MRGLSHPFGLPDVGGLLDFSDAAWGSKYSYWCLVLLAEVWSWANDVQENGDQ